MIALAGTALNIKYPIVGIVTTRPVNLLARHKRVGNPHPYVNYYISFKEI